MRFASRWGGSVLAMAALCGATAAARAAEPDGIARPLLDPLAFASGWHQEPAPPAGDAPGVADALIDLASGLGIILNKSRELSTERWELRATAYLWYARIYQMESKASSDDMRAGRAKGYIAHTHVTTRDFDDDFGFTDFGDSHLIFNPEIMSRWGPSVLRLSWWMWSDSGGRTLTEDVAYGDRTYQNGSRIDGDASLMESKLIYEYRVAFDKKFVAFAGVGFHFIATFGDFKYSAAWGWDDHGCPLGSGSDPSNNCIDAPPSVGAPAFRDQKEKQFPGAPLLTISVRTEWEPVDMVFLTVDTQSMYLPKVGGDTGVGYGYTDTKLGLWVQASKWVRIGVGARYWFLWVDVAGLDKHDTEFTGRFELRGAWGALTVMFP